MKTIYRALLLSVVILGAITLSSTVHALDYRAGVDTSKTSACTDATTRTDGTPLAPAEIDRVEIEISNKSGFMEKVVFPGGCNAAGPLTYDLTRLPAPGTYDQRARTFATPGGVSAYSPSVPFTWLAPIAAPMPATVME